MTPEEKANKLIEFFKPIVYPYMGSQMLTNDYDDNIILRNAKICAEKCCDEVMQNLKLNFDDAWIFQAKEEARNYLSSHQNYWQQVKQIINEK